MDAQVMPKCGREEWHIRLWRSGGHWFAVHETGPTSELRALGRTAADAVQRIAYHIEHGRFPCPAQPCPYHP